MYIILREGAIVGSKPKYDKILVVYAGNVLVYQKKQKGDIEHFYISLWFAVMPKCTAKISKKLWRVIEDEGIWRRNFRLRPEGVFAYAERKQTEIGTKKYHHFLQFLKSDMLVSY